MSLFKKRLTEPEAASFFVQNITKEVQKTWPDIYHSLIKFEGKFVVENENKAVFDLVLAAIAQDLQSVKNLFPKDQADRIEKWIFKCIDTEEYGEYAVNEVKKYGERFQEEIQNIEAGGDPLSAIPGRLLQRWLGRNIHNFTVKETGIVSPLLLMMVQAIVNSFIGIWKTIKDNFKLVEGDMPLEAFEENPIEPKGSI